MSPFWRQALESARTDLITERRTGETATVIIPFGLVALMAFPFALGLDLPLVSRIGSPVFWSLGLLFGAQIISREAAADTPARRDLYALLAVDPAARFAGRALAGTSLVGFFLLVTFLVMMLLYSPQLPSSWYWVTLASIALFAVGIAELGALATGVTAGLKGRSMLAPMLIAPLGVPLLIGASQAMQALQRGSVILPWMLLLLTADLVLAVVGVAVARPLEEARR